MKKITVTPKCIGYGLKYIGWSGRGWVDGGPAGAGPLSSRAPSWDSYGQEIGINMVRIGFSIKHFLPAKISGYDSLPDQIKKGLENREACWAKSEQTSYSYALHRCRDLGWKALICLNPSYKSPWNPSRITSSSTFLKIWKDFCFGLAKFIAENYPAAAEYFEITNEPDIGYFDGESFLPHYQGPGGGISPSQYMLLLQNAWQGIKNAWPQAKIIGPGLASWNREWIAKILRQGRSYVDGISYHNVGGHLKDRDTLDEARSLLSRYAPHAVNSIFNSEWAWWPYHDPESLETALRIAHILYLQTSGKACGSLYLGPSQASGFKKGLGVLKFDPSNPNQVKRTRTFYAFRLMARGVKGGKQMEVIHAFKKLKMLALLRERKELVITIINPSRKRFKKMAIRVDASIPLKKESYLVFSRFDIHHNDSLEKKDSSVLERFDVEPKSIIQFVVPISGP